ncbi:MAG: type II toxin-antitoxin system RelE family toxin [Dehalococcoidia bacterium]
MTRWKVTWTRTAQSSYLRMSKDYRQKVRKAVEELEADPFSSASVKRLHGGLEGLYRYRIGKFRMVFRVIEEAREVRILAMASRGDVYR